MTELQQFIQAFRAALAFQAENILRQENEDDAAISGAVRLVEQALETAERAIAVPLDPPQPRRAGQSPR